MASKKKPATGSRAAKATKSKKAAPAKKAAAKKAGTKKSPAKKPAAKKPAAKTAKKAATTKAATKKVSAKKAATKKAATKKVSAKTPASKQAAAKPKKKPAPRKSPFGKKFIDAQRKQLQSERARYFNSAEIYRAEADSLLEGREPGDVQFDEESGEGDTLAIERSRDLTISNMARAAVEEIDAALARIDAGTYGICTTSGKPIPKERLEALPWAAVRVEVKVARFQ